MGYNCPSGRFGFIEEEVKQEEEPKPYKAENPFKQMEKKEDNNGLEWSTVEWDQWR